MSTARSIRTPRSVLRDTTLIRAFAALLVTNSHLEHYYPYPWLAGDGLVGNSLFFLLAGYGLARSAQRATPAFWPWLARRIDRIYPTLVPVVFVFGVVVDAGWRRWNFGDYVTNIVWPTRYSFVELVVPFYLLFFWFVRAGRARAYAIGVGALVLVYLTIYAEDVGRIPAGVPLRLGDRPIWVHAVSYLQIMLLGGWLASTAEADTPRIATRPATAIVLGVVYLAAKFAMVKGVGARAYPILHVFTFAICLSTFAVLTDADVVRRARAVRPLWVVAAFVGGLTLEIYLVHTYLVDYERLWRVAFPLNVGLFWLLTLPLSAVAGRVAAQLQSLLGGRDRGARLGSADDVGASA